MVILQTPQGDSCPTIVPRECNDNEYLSYSSWGGSSIARWTLHGANPDAVKAVCSPPWNLSNLFKLFNLLIWTRFDKFG